MKTRTLGSSDLSVSCIGLGGMPLSIAGRPDEATAIRVIHAAIDNGMTFIDTADVYCLDNSDIGHNERLIARALGELGSKGKDIIVATKGGLERPGGAWVSNGQPKHLKKACEASLAALGVDCIDLYQLHAPDSNVPFTDTIRTLADLQQEGKIRHIGLSNVTVAEIAAASKMIDIVSVQNRCNPFDITSFATGVVKYCAENNLAFLPHSPVGGHHGHTRVPKDPVLTRLAEQHSATPYQICLAFMLSVHEVMIPIPGASRLDSAISSARAADLVLGDADLAALRKRFPSVGI